MLAALVLLSWPDPVVAQSPPSGRPPAWFGAGAQPRPAWAAASRNEPMAARGASSPRLLVDRSRPSGGSPQGGGPNGDGPSNDPGGGGTGMPYPYPYYAADCGTDLLDVVVGEGLDLASRGFDWRLPGDGFALLSFAAREACEYVGPWNEDGSPPEEVEARLVVDSSYRHREGESDVQVSQRAQTTPTANVLYPYAATFSTSGYGYWVSSYGNVYVAGPTGGPTGAPGGPEEPALTPDQVVELTVRGLAPELDLACFYRRASGTWADLPLLGVGDPRPALPEKFEEISFYLDRLVAPPASCGATAPNQERDYWSASFQRGGAPGGDPTGEPGGGGSTGGEGNEGGEGGEGGEKGTEEDWGWISVSAGSRLPEDPEWPGTFDGTSLSWSNDSHFFSIYGYDRGQGFEDEVLFAIARALDPDFDPDTAIGESQRSVPER